MDTVNKIIFVIISQFYMKWDLTFTAGNCRPSLGQLFMFVYNVWYDPLIQFKF